MLTIHLNLIGCLDSSSVISAVECSVTLSIPTCTLVGASRYRVLAGVALLKLAVQECSSRRNGGGWCHKYSAADHRPKAVVDLTVYKEIIGSCKLSRSCCDSRVTYSHYVLLLLLNSLTLSHTFFCGLVMILECELLVVWLCIRLPPSATLCHMTASASNT